LSANRNGERTRAAGSAGKLAPLTLSEVLLSETLGILEVALA